MGYLKFNIFLPEIRLLFLAGRQRLHVLRRASPHADRDGGEDERRGGGGAHTRAGGLTGNKDNSILFLHNLKEIKIKINSF